MLRSRRTLSTLPALDQPGRARRRPLLAALTAALMLAVGLWASGSAAASGTTATASAITPTSSCSAAAGFNLLALKGANTEITSATSVAASANPAGSWAACEVQGIIAPETHFTLYLPTST